MYFENIDYRDQRNSEHMGEYKLYVTAKQNTVN